MIFPWWRIVQLIGLPFIPGYITWHLTQFIAEWHTYLSYWSSGELFLY